MGLRVNSPFAYQPRINYNSNYQNNFNNFGSNLYQQNNTSIFNNYFSSQPAVQSPVIMQQLMQVNQPQQQDNSSGMMQMLSAFLPMLFQSGGSERVVEQRPHNGRKIHELKDKIADLQSKMDSAEASRSANANWLMAGGPSAAGTAAWQFYGQYQQYDKEKKELEDKLDRLMDR